MCCENRLNLSQGQIISCSAVSQASVLPVSHMISKLESHVTAISWQLNGTGGAGVLINKSVFFLTASPPP